MFLSLHLLLIFGPLFSDSSGRGSGFAYCLSFFFFKKNLLPFYIDTFRYSATKRRVFWHGEGQVSCLRVDDEGFAVMDFVLVVWSVYERT